MSKVILFTYLSPYINFQGRAREAMEFYQKALGGKLDMQTSDEQGVPKPAGPGDRITNARLEADGALILGTDGHPNYPAKVGENVAIAMGGTDAGRLIKIFNALGEGPGQDAADRKILRWLSRGQIRYQLGVHHRQGVTTLNHRGGRPPCPRSSVRVSRPER